MTPPGVDATIVVRRLEIVDLEETLLTAAYPIVATEAVGVEACDNHRLIVELRMTAAECAEKRKTRLMPSRGDDGGLALGTDGAEEVDRLVVRVGQTETDDLMTYTDVEALGDVAGNVELLESDLAASLHFRLVLAVLGILELLLDAYSASLELNLETQIPLLVETIVGSDDGTGHGDCASLVAIVLTAIETVASVVEERCDHLAIAADAELIVAFVVVNRLSSCCFCLLNWLYFGGASLSVSVKSSLIGLSHYCGRSRKGEQSGG